MKYLLGIDFGGGASKATLIGDDGKIYATHTTEYETIYSKPGFAEQNPEEWVSATIENIKGVLSKSRVDAGDIIAISLDAATHTAVIMDENFKPIRNAIYWTDTRSTKEVEFLKENYADVIDKEVLHKPDTIWTLPELLWIKNNDKENWANVEKILFAKDYVRHKLTGDYVTDYIEAEGSMMFDINTLKWSDELLGILGLDASMMPEIKKPTDIVGTVTKEAELLTGLKEGTKVLCGTTDTVMEVFASGAVKKGQMTLKLATAGRICVITDKPYPDVNLINYSHVIDSLFYPGTATKSCAASYRWFRDTFGGDYKELDKMAQSIPIGSDGLVFHPYLNGELTPYANPNLCADFVGVRASHTKAHFTRSVLEGVAMSMLDSKEALDSLNIEHDDAAVIIGGGGKSPLWRQMISDALGIKLYEMKYADSSFGSAMLAGVAMGIFENYEDALNKCNEVISETLPNEENTKQYRKLFKKYKAVQKALEPIYNGNY
ncbi:MAG: xylulokinase [Ruminococcaceae bacterium]|nr:xylulokinase [Oscillospiraceae bacterium]